VLVIYDDLREIWLISAMDGRGWGSTCCGPVGVDNSKMVLSRASVNERYENSVTSGRLTVLSDTLFSCGHHHFSKGMLS
jgi:hypothetical protein